MIYKYLIPNPYFLTANIHLSNILSCKKDESLDNELNELGELISKLMFINNNSCMEYSNIKEPGKKELDYYILKYAERYKDTRLINYRTKIPIATNKTFLIYLVYMLGVNPKAKLVNVTYNDSILTLEVNESKKGVKDMVTYDSLMNKINKINEDLETRKFKRQLKEEEKLQGYSPRCSICTHEDVDEIERLRDLGYTYEEIVEELNLDVSIMSLSRHFKNHYPNKTRYRLKQEKLMLEKVVEAIDEYPFLENYFNNKPYEYVKEFINYNGFCTDCFRLCKDIPAGYVTSSNVVLASYSKLIDQETNSYYMDNKEVIRLLTLKDKCLNCRNNSLADKLNLLESIIAKSVLGLEELDRNELLYLLYTKYDNDTGALIDDLKILEK